MATDYKGYEKKKKRWVHMIDGERFRVTCEQLGLPKEDWTQERSYQAKKKYFEAIEEEKSRERAIIQKLKKQEEYRQFLKDEFNIDTSLKDYSDEQTRFVAMALDTVLNEEEVEGMSGVSPSTKKERRLDNCIQKVLPLFTKGNAIATFDQYRKELQHIEDTFGKDFDVSTFKEKDVSRYFEVVQKLEIVERGKAKLWAMFKRLLSYLEEDNAIERLPKNLNSKLLSFSRSYKKQINEYETKEVIQFINRFDEKNEYWKMIVLLSLNTAMQTADISELRQTTTYKEGKKIFQNPVGIDWEQRRIIRSRVKLKRLDNPPISSYLLWDSTFELLQKYRTTDKDYVLLTPTGKPWKRGRTNDMVEAYGKLEIDGKIPLKDFRSIGTTALGARFNSYQDHYLGNTSDSIKNAHYDAKQQKEFDKAIKFLGKIFDQK